MNNIKIAKAMEEVAPVTIVDTRNKEFNFAIKISSALVVVFIILNMKLNY